MQFLDERMSLQFRPKVSLEKPIAFGIGILIQANRLPSHQVGNGVSWKQESQEEDRAADKGAQGFAAARSFQDPGIKRKEQACEYGGQNDRHEECLDHDKEQNGRAEDDEQKGVV